MYLEMQLGVTREGSRAHQEGWAWIGALEGSEQGVIEAYRLSDLVQNTLRIQVRTFGLPFTAL